MSAAGAGAHLLDTHILLWALREPERLSGPARAAVLAGGNVLSVVSYWEVTIKSMKGLLDVGDPRAWWAEALEKLVATALPLRHDHVGAVWELPPIHKDPFDRILIAQAKVEGLALVSADANVAKYGAAGVRVVR